MTSLIRFALLTAVAVLVASPPVAAQAEPPPYASLRTIDPHDLEFSDLEPLGEWIGDARVVQLAEYAHGFGDSFDARIRITRYLHQRLGFDVVLFETPLLLSKEMNAALRGDGPIEDAIDLSMFPIWAHSEQMMELFRYIRDTGTSQRPMDLLGVDAQFTYYPGEAEAVQESVAAVLRHDSDPVVAEMLAALAEMLPRVRVGSGFVFDGAQFLRARVLLTDLMFALEAPSIELRNSTSPAERAWAHRILLTLSRMVEQRALQALAPPFRGDVEEYARHSAVHAAQNRRDQAMADNIAWIAREYMPGRRIIVWNANSHAQEAPGPAFPGDSGLVSVRQHTTGSYLTRMLGEDQVFTLLHTAYTGVFAGNFVQNDDTGFVWSEHSLRPASDGTLAAALHQAGLEYALVDLRNTATEQPALRSVLDDEKLRPLREYGDAVLFIDHDRPSRPRPGLDVTRSAESLR